MELGPFPTSLGLAILQVYTDELNARRPPDTKTILHKPRKRIATRGKNCETEESEERKALIKLSVRREEKGILDSPVSCNRAISHED